MRTGAQEPAAAALLRLRVLREVLPPQRAEADVSDITATALSSSGHLIIATQELLHVSAAPMVVPRTIGSCMLSRCPLSFGVGAELN